eukprot:TRINITY_DN367_c0_g1_i2.p1 TRINITY_DN367_c0_g1~~TRINITY_DN367_c0_g1_i2.p1  ORF type:complete len:489 (+),score=136.51 TRINITY_DN367_c0_g1_i2:401-1867(+)
MALVNIGQSNKDDGFYRYKMPKLITKIEGRGNGIKTNVVNMVEVAKALARPPSYTTKFFGCVLGAQSKFDEKTGTSTVNGAHDTAKLVQHLETFIKKYVQCYGCGNPETEILITKQQTINLKCAACGFVSDVDMRDKLTTFILNNPPEVKKAKGSKNMRRAEKERLKAGEALDEDTKKKPDKSKKEGSKKSKKEKKGSDEDDTSNGRQNGEKHSAPEEDDDDDVEWLTDTSAKAAKQRIMEQLTKATSEMVTLELVDEPKKAAVESDDKVKAEENEKSPSKDAVNGKKSSAESSPGTSPSPSSKKFQTLDESVDEEGDEAEVEEANAHAKLVADLTDYVKTHNLAETATFISKLENLDADQYLAVLEAVFMGAGKGLSKEMTKKKGLLCKIVPSEQAQALFLIALELYCAKISDAVKEIPLVLKVLYDEEIVEEEQILEWYGKKTLDKYVGKAKAAMDAKVAQAVRKSALPFVEWLKEAEAESDGDEE